MFAQRSRLTLLGLGLLATGLLGCQGQQQTEPGKPIDFNAGGFEGLESGQFALLNASCDTTANPVVVTVASGEFAYLYKRSSDDYVVVNANASAGGQCAFPSTKKISIVAPETDTGAQSHKVLIDFLSGQFSQGDDTAPGIAIDLKSTGVNQVMFRGTTNPDVFTLGSVGTTSYLAFATGESTPVTAPTFANVSLTNVSDITITAGPGDDIIDGQATALTAPESLVALHGAVNLTAHGGDGNDHLTSGAASIGTARNSLNGGNGSDVFHQPLALASDVISGGTDPTVTLTLTGTATGTDTAVVVLVGTTTDTATATASANQTLTDSQTKTGTKTYNLTGTATASATVSKTSSVNTTATVTATGERTSTTTSTWTGTYLGTGTATGTKSYTGTMTSTATFTASFTLTATGATTGEVTATGSKTATTVVSASGTKAITQTFTSVVTSLTNTSVQTDISTDVVDYSARSAALKVTLGDDEVATAASAKIVLPGSDAIRSYDSFAINDGVATTSVVEFHRKGSYAVGDITAPTNGAADLEVDDTFTINDGVNTVTFHFAIADGTGERTSTGTSTATNTNAVITVDEDDDKDAVATKVFDGIKKYQTSTWTGTATGTATMTSTTIVPNVTVLEPDTDAKISVQTRNAPETPPTLLAQDGDGVSVGNGDAAELWNVNEGAIAVVLDDTAEALDGSAVATLVAAAIPGESGLAVVASATDATVTITASGDIAVKSGFAVTRKSGGFDITVVSTGTPADGPGANDGDIADSGEKDAILNDIETVIGGSGNDTIDASQSTNIVHKLFGMAGDDTLVIGTLASGGDMLYGGPGNDHLLGGGGVQTLYGGDGNDFVAGGPGNDLIDGDGPNCVVASAGVYAPNVCDATFAAASETAGSNYLDYSDRSTAVTVDLGNLADASQVGVEGEKDIVTNCTNVRGGSAGDSLTGNSAANIIYGGPGDDSINGGGGSDSLYGDSGNDNVSGGAGDDYVYGGSGVNNVWGDAAGYTGTAGINMLDNSEGRGGVVDCGAGDMDILFSNGEETGTNTCELK